jgi:hypothetical protein
MGWRRWEPSRSVLTCSRFLFDPFLREMIKIPQAEISAIRREAEIIATGLHAVS